MLHDDSRGSTTMQTLSDDEGADGGLGSSGRWSGEPIEATRTVPRARRSYGLVGTAEGGDAMIVVTGAGGRLGRAVVDSCSTTCHPGRSERASAIR